MVILSQQRFRFWTDESAVFQIRLRSKIPFAAVTAEFFLGYRAEFFLLLGLLFLVELFSTHIRCLELLFFVDAPKK